jgi:hypothetical protein
MKTAGLYDGNLQMFREPPRELDIGTLRFLRWLAEQDRLEHGTVGPAGGEVAILFGGRHAHVSTTHRPDEKES